MATFCQLSDKIGLLFIQTCGHTVCGKHFFALFLLRSRSYCSFSTYFVPADSCSVTSGQSYKASTIVIYESRVVNISNYDCGVIIYDRRSFIRLATDVYIIFYDLAIFSKLDKK